VRFAEGVDRLKENVGHGKLECVVTVDQVYAWNQHEGFWRTGPNAGVVIRNYPRGGQGKYLEQPLLQHASAYFMEAAREALHDHGLEGAFRKAGDDLLDKVHELAPRENDILRNSVRVQVISDGHVVYDRPPVFPRLSAEELKLIRAGHATPREVVRRRRG
jgi:hypothetical protein